MTLSEEARNYALLVAKKREAEASLDALKAELTRLEADLLQRMGDEGIASLKVETDEGRFTLSPRRELWASTIPGCEADLASGLRAIGYGDMVKEVVNSQRLSSYIREIDRAGEAIPAEVVGAIKVSEKYRVGVTRASGS